MIDTNQLNAYVGKSIGQICQNNFANDFDNHCAHFVSHVLALQFGVTCRTMGQGNGAPANLRVQEVFPRCPLVGVWSLRPVTLTPCLVFITKASNVDLKTKTMANMPRKHVGIFLAGLIWHYSNSQRQVIRQAPEQFSRHYPPPDNALFYGSLP